MSNPINVDDFRRRARRRLPRAVFDFIEGGVGDERCLRRNRESLKQLRFLPKRFRDVSAPDLTTELFGDTLAAPLMIGPLGWSSLLWPKGDLALARAASKAGIPFALATVSDTSIEEVVVHAQGHIWSQLYVAERAAAQGAIERALRAGCRTLMLTVDVPVNGRRERDLRNKFDLTGLGSARMVAVGLSRPKWLYHFIRERRSILRRFGENRVSTALLGRQMDSSLTWDYLRALRRAWPHRLVVKGVLDLNDAAECVRCGVDAIVLSNHGGRQLDDVPPAICLLTKASLDLSAPLLVDGGFRRGWDILKAVALGARVVSLGRAAAYGLAAGGEAGVSDVISILREEMLNTLAQIGCPSVRALTSDYIFDAPRQLAPPLTARVT
jgi:(S)-mandelate dehydrogenase